MKQKPKEKVGIIRVVLPEVETLWLKANAANVSQFCSTLLLREVRKMMREQLNSAAMRAPRPNRAHLGQ